MMKTITKEPFEHDQIQKLNETTEFILNCAKQNGATQSEVGVALQQGFSVSLREAQVEKVEYHHEKSINITVYFGNRSGSSSISDLRQEAVRDAVLAACHIAKYTSVDPHSGLAEENELGFHYPHLNLYYPWSISVDDAVRLASSCEASAKSLDARISSTEEISVSTASAYSIYANSRGFSGHLSTSHHQLNCTLIAKEKDDMQRDGAFTLSCDPHELWSVERVAKEAVLRTVKRLNARRLPTMTAPVIFLAEEARSLFGHFASANSGGNIYRKSSFLLDKTNELIFPEWLTIYEQPWLSKGLGTTPFDDDGVLTRENHFVEKGVLKHHSLGVYSARQLGLKTTGNAGGVHNLTVTHQSLSLDALIKKMHKGLIVHEVMGQGVNIITGDYSRGVVGFWVENGEIQYPVHEITVASNLKDMFKNIAAISDDVDHRGNILTGSVLISEMTIAGD